MQSCPGNEVCPSGDRGCNAACEAEGANICSRPNGAGDSKLSPGIICFSFPPVAVPKSDAPAPPPKLVVSDRSQSLIVAQQTFHLLTHVQRIEGITDETVEWWELRD